MYQLAMVEDNETQLLGITTRLAEEQEWVVKVFKTPKEVLSFLQVTPPMQHPDLISIDLGLLDEPDKPIYGLQLIQAIRQSWGNLSLVVHGNITRVRPDIVQSILLQSASYFHLGTEGALEAYVHALSLMKQGYVILSPGPASYLPQIMVWPDPLICHPEYWDLLVELETGKSYKDIGAVLGLEEQGVQARVNNVYSLLVQAGEILTQPEASTKINKRYILEAWYHQNKFRRRPKQQKFK